MADVVNLRRARKQRDRVLEARQAAENRVRHGQTKAEKLVRKAIVTKADRGLDQVKLED